MRSEASWLLLAIAILVCYGTNFVKAEERFLQLEIRTNSNNDILAASYQNITNSPALESRTRNSSSSQRLLNPKKARSDYAIYFSKSIPKLEAYTSHLKIAQQPLTGQRTIRSVTNTPNSTKKLKKSHRKRIRNGQTFIIPGEAPTDEVILTKSTTSSMITISPKIPPATQLTIPPCAPAIVPTTVSPIAKPTATSTLAPTEPTTVSPTLALTLPPTSPPTVRSTATPTTVSPTAAPTAASNTVPPTVAPTEQTTVSPTSTPTVPPTAAPTIVPPTAASNTVITTSPPTVPTTAAPTVAPTEPTTVPTTSPPTMSPNAAPTAVSTAPPTSAPTAAPTEPPISTPTVPPTISPTVRPTILPCPPHPLYVKYPPYHIAPPRSSYVYSRPKVPHSYPSVAHYTRASAPNNCIRISDNGLAGSRRSTRIVCFPRQTAPARIITPRIVHPPKPLPATYAAQRCNGRLCNRKETPKRNGCCVGKNVYARKPVHYPAPSHKFLSRASIRRPIIYG